MIKSLQGPALCTASYRPEAIQAAWAGVDDRVSTWVTRDISYPLPLIPSAPTPWSQRSSFFITIRHQPRCTLSPLILLAVPEKLQRTCSQFVGLSRGPGASLETKRAGRAYTMKESRKLDMAVCGCHPSVGDTETPIFRAHQPQTNRISTLPVEGETLSQGNKEDVKKGSQ